MKRRRYTKADFAWVTWGPSEFENTTKELLAYKKAAYAAIRAIPAKDRTFANTVLALEATDDRYSDETSRIGILKEASPDPKVRSAAAAALEKLNKALVDVEYDPRMYGALKEYARKKEKLSGPEKLLFDDLMKGYARMGFDLPKATQAKLKANMKQLTKLAMAFDRNVNEYKDFILVTETELDGLPETYRSMLTKVGDRYKITLAYPEAHPFLAGAHDEQKRKELSEKFSRRGGPANVTLLKKMFKIRAESAKLLGYKTYADFQTELRMVKNAKTVLAFINDLERRTRKPAHETLAMLHADKKRRTGDPKAKLYSHDISYLFKQIRKERFDIDSDVVKEYFPFEHVKQATLDAYQKLLGITFKRRADLTLWHEDVQAYDIFDKRTGSYLSTFLLDLYPRDGKYGHAAAFDIIYGREDGDRYIAPLACMMTNFPKPSATNPSLMTHGEVEVFFHEFGHIMHFTLTTARYRAQAGFNVSWDFVEAPSQMLENWVWDPKMLSLLSKHYKTGRPLPKDLAKRIIDAKLFGEAWSTRGQLVLAMLDMALHTKPVADPVKLYADLQKRYVGIAPPDRQIWIAGFGHIAHGYDAGYYCYLWSKVYAEDMFTRFAEEGILNSKTGRDYRTWILEKGSSMEEMDLVKGFLGRKPNSKAFLKAIGA